MESNKLLALITCYFQPNYGSQLQAFATQQVFDLLGVKNETIRIDGLLKEIKKGKYKYFLSKIFDVNTVMDKMATIRKKFALRTNLTYRKNLSLRTRKFNDFANYKFHLSKDFLSKKELGKSGLYAAFVVGSDQLWLPSNIEADYYTLNFVPEVIPKIAFATSFGISSIPKSQIKRQHFF